MKKIYFILFVIIVFGVIYGLLNIDYKKPAGVENGEGAVDPFNAIYLVEGRAVKLENRYFESEIAPGSASKMKVSVFGEPVYGDMDGDDDDDALLILTVDNGGSGTFYYATLALNAEDGWRGINAVLLGDRISPQNNKIENNLAIVNYSIRKEDEAMTVSPHIGVSDYLYFEAGNLIKAELNNPNIFLIKPNEGFLVFSPLEIRGYARGNWYFEADFPVILTDWDGKIIAEGIARAKSDWMTESFVPFEVVLNFESPYKTGDPEFMKRGSLILKKDNPSDLPEYDDALEITISF